MFYWFFKNSKKYKTFLEYKDILEYEIKLLIEYNIKDFLDKQKDIDFISKNIRKYYTLLAGKLINSSKMKYDDNQRILIFKEMLSSINSSCYYMLSQNVSHKDCDKIITKTINYFIKYLETYHNIDIQEDSFHTLYLQHAFMIAYFQVTGKNTKNRFKEYKEDITKLLQEAAEILKKDKVNEFYTKLLLKYIKKYTLITAIKIINNKSIFYTDNHKMQIYYYVAAQILRRGEELIDENIEHKYFNKIFKKFAFKIIELVKSKPHLNIMNESEMADFFRPYMLDIKNECIKKY